MNGEKVIVPFKKEVDLANPKDWIATDINESNITAVSSNSTSSKLTMALERLTRPTTR